MRELSLLLDFDEQYRRDQQQDAGFLHRRDRHLATDDGLDARDDVGVWLRAVRDQPATPAHHDPRLRTWRALRWVFAAIGAVLGIVTMLGLLWYNGGQRISVTLIMAVAMLQLLLAAATTAQALIGWRPWHGLYKGGWPRWLGKHGEHAPMVRALQAPLAAGVAHTGGLAFAVAALVTLLAQVLFHDLAFGWSTTLQTSAPAFHALTSALAWPWRGWLPGAVPSLDLVHQSRYFRASRAAISDPALLGIWWRFLAMLWLCYVVVPRVLGLAISRLQLRWRVHRLLASHPGRAALGERCATPWVETEAAHELAPSLTETSRTPEPLRPARVWIRWAGAGSAELAREVHGSATVSLDAGGAASLAADRATLARAAEVGGPVVLAARAWEPPTGELADFLHDARERLGDALIQLLPLADDGAEADVRGAALAPWHRFVERADDSALVLAAMPDAEAT